MAPAIGLLKGRLISAQVYSQYGIGWPLLLARLNPILPLSYANTYKIAVLYGCIYYSGLYWLLRRLLMNPAWALGGLLLALRMQMFHTGRVDSVLWLYPQQSILRTPCDVWVFLLLLAHWRSQKPVWLLMAGAVVGISLLFIIDTGIYLTLTFTCYNLIWLRFASRSRKITQPGGTQTFWYQDSLLDRVGLSVASGLLAVVVLVTGLVAACGTAAFAQGFFHQWLEVLWLYPAGISMIPMVEDTQALSLSYWMTMLYLGCIVAAILRLRFGRRNPAEVIICCMALLGLFYMIYYIGRSELYNIFHLSIPLCIVIAYAVQQMFAEPMGRVARSLGAARSTLFVGSAVILAYVALLLMNPDFQAYPNLLRASLHPAPSQVDCFAPSEQDVCVAATEHPNVLPFQQVVSEMQRMAAPGKRIAVIANDDTALYVESGATPWSRYSPLLPTLVTKSMLAVVDKQLSEMPVDYVFLSRKDPTDHSTHPVALHITTTDAWTKLAATTRRRYHFDHLCGPFEVWRR